MPVPPAETYHTELALALLCEHHPICELVGVNTMVALKHWTPQLQVKKVVLHSNSVTTVTVF